MSKDPLLSKLYSYLSIVVLALVLFTCATSKRKGATCWDGSSSSATGSGACSHHGGVRNWKSVYWWDW